MSIAADQEQDPGAGADAADADDLPRGVHVPVALEQVAAVARQRAPVRADHAPHDVLEVVCSAPGSTSSIGVTSGGLPTIRSSPSTVRQSLESARRLSFVCTLDHVRLEALHLLPGRRCPEAFQDACDVEARVPDVDVAHRREARHRFAVLTHRRHHDRARARPLKPRSRPATRSSRRAASRPTRTAPAASRRSR